MDYEEQGAKHAITDDRGQGLNDSIGSMTSSIDEGLSLDLFEALSLGQTGREIATPRTTRYSTFKKIEVVSARRINAMAGLFNVISLVALLFSATIIILSRTAFAQYFSDVPSLRPGSFMEVTVYEFPPTFILFDSIANFVVFGYAVLLFLFFGIVMITEGNERILNEQMWVLMLLLGTVLYLNPHESIMRLLRDYLGVSIPDAEDGFSYIDVFTCLRMLSFSTISLLYVWMTSHSYRYLTTRVSVKDWRFYIPKITVILIYNIYKLSILFALRIAFAEFPLATLVAFLNLYASVGAWPKVGVITVAILTIMDIVILGLVSADIRKTFQVLNTAEYVKHRTKILCFRFFLHQQGIFYAVYATIFGMVLFGLPKGVQILQFILFVEEGDGRGSYFDVQYVPLGLHLLILAYVTTEAYTNLPSSFTWEQILFSGSEDRLKEQMEPIVYRNTEPRSFHGDGPDLRPNCFVMQTNIELFNLSWYVYYHGTRKQSNLKIDFNALTLKIRESLYNKETDTRAFIATSPDRIIIAFKGTTSTQNFFTDIKVLHRSLPQVIGPTRRKSPETAADDRRVSDVLHSRKFKKAKVHAGFVEAYNSIKEQLMNATEALLEEKSRPIYFTGHSLGGALATLSSLDVSLTLDVPGSKIVVSTFGSPRVGNKLFQDIYDATIPMNWRVVAGGDIVSRLPKIGYEHVGKKVILSTAGELFIDPSALEVIFWHSPPASVVHHKKSWYLLSMKSFCDAREGPYRPKFWPFPVSESDSRRFKTTREKPTSNRFPSLTRRERGINAVDKYKQWADAIDAMDVEIRNEESLVAWRSLALGILEIVRNAKTED